MKREYQLPMEKVLAIAAPDRKRVPHVLNLLRMRSDYARRQRVTGSWTSNLNAVSPNS